MPHSRRLVERIWQTIRAPVPHTLVFAEDGIWHSSYTLTQKTFGGYTLENNNRLRMTSPNWGSDYYSYDLGSKERALSQPTEYHYLQDDELIFQEGLFRRSQ